MSVSRESLAYRTSPNDDVVEAYWIGYHDGAGDVKDLRGSAKRYWMSVVDQLLRASEDKTRFETLWEEHKSRHDHS